MKKLTLMSLLLAMALPTWAEVNINGFASIRGGILTDGTQTNIPGNDYSDDLSFDKESLFALQASSNLGNGLSATMQMMAEGKNNYDLEAKWAYLSYDLTPNTKLKAGRLVNPIFSRTEYLDVGYSYPYARMPKAVYTVFDFSVISGVSLDSNFALGGGDLSTKVMVGNWTGIIPLQGGLGDHEMSLNNLVHLSAVYTWDGFSFFAGAFQGDVASPTLGNEGVLNSLGIDASALSATETKTLQSVLAIDGPGQYMYYGFSMDKMNILVDFEAAKYGIDDSADAENDTYYFGVGYRFGDYTLMAHVEDYEHDTEGNIAEANGVSTTVIGFTAPDGSAANAPAIAVAQNALTSFGLTSFTGNGLTLRYDFHEQAALKVDYFTYSYEPYQAVKEESSGMTVGIDMMF